MLPNDVGALFSMTIWPWGVYGDGPSMYRFVGLCPELVMVKIRGNEEAGLIEFRSTRS
jgi:hypothetical protein